MGQTSVPPSATLRRTTGGSNEASYGCSSPASPAGGDVSSAGGSSLSPRLHRFYLNIGLPLYVGYGLTETSPVLAANFQGENRAGTVGPAYPGVELRISEDGEILARGTNIMRRYHNQPAKTAKTIIKGAWLRTGDLGRFDKDGFLTIIGRSKELFKTSTGKYVSTPKG